MEYISGKEVAQQIKEKIKLEVNSLERKPSLAILLNKDDESSKGYVKALKKTADELSILVNIIEMEQEESKYITMIETLNEDDSVDAVLITRPLNNLDENKIISKLKSSKDVDGIDPINLGKLFTGQEIIVPSTAMAMIKMLEYYDIPLKGKNVLVVGRSLSVGKPMACLLLNRHATVSIAHSRTENLKQMLNQYDIVIAAVGKPHILDGHDMKEGAIVIDAGIHYTEDGIKGDVKPADKLKYLSKVPGGVGPITTACLMESVLQCYKENNNG